MHILAQMEKALEVLKENHLTAEQIAEDVKKV